MNNEELKTALQTRKPVILTMPQQGERQKQKLRVYMRSEKFKGA